MCKASAFGPASGRHSKTRAIDAHNKRCAGLSSCAVGFSGHRCAEWNHAAFVASIGTSPHRGRIGLKAKPIPHDLRVLPIGESSFGHGWNMLEQRVDDLV